MEHIIPLASSAMTKLNVRRVVVGISGGIDSAVSALLLKAKGYDVVGAYMKNWDLTDEIGTCTSVQDDIDAQWVCKMLGIKLHYVNFVKEYWNDVFSYLLNDYVNGYTPNPDIICNKTIKFNSFYNYAVETLGADAIATGHYARTSYGDYLEGYNRQRGVRLLKSVDSFKDQTFFLSQVSQNALQRTMFPLGNLTKGCVRRIAQDVGMERLIKKKESVGICFIGSRNFQSFISEYVTSQKGYFIDIENGVVLGEHVGIHAWTIGQNCKLAGYSKPYFVAKKDLATQAIFVAPGTNHPSLFTQHFVADKVHWIHSIPKVIQEYGVLSCDFRFQHTKPLTRCLVVLLPDGNILVKLGVALRAITLGQYAVFYQGQECLGSARIHRLGPSLFSLQQDVDLNGLKFS